jgi:hypothetical protein
VGTGPGDTVPVAARLTALRSDSVATTAGGVTVTTDSSEIGTSTFFHGAPGNTTIRARFAGAQFGGTSRQFLVVTIQSDSTAPVFDATTPRPLFLRYRNATTPFAVLASGTGQFGIFSATTTPYLYVAGGRGRSAFWDRNRDGRLLYSAIVENLTYPPLGYYYQPWLRDTRTRRAVRFGELVDTLGHSLRDADLTVPTSSVAQLPPGRFQTSEQEIGVPLVTFDGVHLVLEPKLGDTSLALTTVLLGAIGDTLVNRGLGALEVLVLRGQEPVAGASIVVVPVHGNAPIGAPRPALTLDTLPQKSKKGTAIVTGIPAGLVDIYVTPPTGSAPASPTRAEVVRQDTVGVTVTLP